MATIDTGTMAPEFTWPGTDGKTYSLKTALQSGPMVVAFFKVSCPVCQMTFPYLDRIARQFGRVWGVSQDDDRATRDFAKTFGVSFPLLLEDTDDYPTSNAYGLDHVPSIFLIGSNGEILISCVGFGRQDLMDMAAKLAESAGNKGFTLFQPSDNAPAFKAG